MQDRSRKTQFQLSSLFEVIEQIQARLVCPLSQTAEHAGYFSLMQLESERAEDMQAPLLAAWEAEVVGELSQWLQINM